MKKILLLSAMASITLTTIIVFTIFSSLGISKEQVKRMEFESVGEVYIVAGEYDLASKARSLPVEMKIADVRK